MAKSKQPNKLTRDQQRLQDLASLKGKQREDRKQEGVAPGLAGAGRKTRFKDKSKYDRKRDKKIKEGSFAPASLGAGDCLVLDDGFFFVRSASESHLHLDGPYEQLFTDRGEGPYGWATVLASRMIGKPWYSSTEDSVECSK